MFERIPNSGIPINHGQEVFRHPNSQTSNISNRTSKAYKPHDSRLHVSGEYQLPSQRSLNIRDSPTTSFPPTPRSKSINMCMRVVEVYSVCKCVYFTHGIDQCSAYGRHDVEKRVVLVGHTCPSHSGAGFQYSRDYSGATQSHISGVIPDFSYTSSSSAGNSSYSTDYSTR